MGPREPVSAPKPEPESAAKKGGAMDEIKAVFNGNVKKITDLELQLAKRRTQIVEFANQFMVYIAIVEHPMNDFDSMDPKIFHGIIRPQVIDYIKNDV